MRHLVIVESPAKAKTINQYLGSEYTVLASYGHIRDLPPKDGSVLPDDHFKMLWELTPQAGAHTKRILEAMKTADTLSLATDPDREGEAIAWHVEEWLKQKKALKNCTVQRVVFNEITKKAVAQAFEHPRGLNQELVDAYLARRALDYLVGFTLSPLLWRKLPGSRSAGRVQSVALRIICDREAEIEQFKTQEYWTVAAALLKDKTAVRGRLTHLKGKKLEKFDLGNEAAAFAARDQVIAAEQVKVVNVTPKRVRRSPAAPFITSTLQQEAARKLYFSASQTMRTAQKLYEGVTIGGELVGLISYMRTDSTALSTEAVQAARAYIGSHFGAAYVPEAPRAYKKKVKGAQEAHEAIRPTRMDLTPAAVRDYLSAEQYKLYELIWQRTIACQMADAVFDQVSVELEGVKAPVTLNAHGSQVVFDGFLKLYEEGQDDAEEDEEDRRLPPLVVGDVLPVQGAEATQHFTQPPARYSEASLVKKLEELGIGRPSTYASIIQVLQDRAYVRLEKRRFYPESRGLIVTSFLKYYFHTYIEDGFTAALEEQLDDISAGDVPWRTVMENFWVAFRDRVGSMKNLTITEVLDALDADLDAHFFPQVEGVTNPRACPKCGDGTLHLKLGKFGGFIGCSNYPTCTYTRKLTGDDGAEEGENSEAAEYPKLLGAHPTSGLPVTVRKGPYGFYVQEGEGKKGGPTPRRSSLPKDATPDTVTLEAAVEWLALPRDLGLNGETQKPMIAGLGRRGPYIKHGTDFISIPAEDDVYTITSARAAELVTLDASQPKKPKRYKKK